MSGTIVRLHWELYFLLSNVTNLCFINGTLTRKKSINILRQNIPESANDNRFFNKNDIRFPPWSPQSHDLNPIEQLNHLDRIVKHLRNIKCSFRTALLKV